MMTTEEEWDRIIVADMQRLLGDAVPEKRDEVNRIVAQLGLHWEVDHNDGTQGIRAAPETGTITVSIPYVNRQLAMAFGYVKCYCAVVRITREVGHVVPWPEGDRQFETGLEYLRWAMREHLRALAAAERGERMRHEVWVADLPMPNPEALEDTDDRIALELYYMALAVDLHHELWHIRFGHSGRPIDPDTRVVDDSPQAHAKAVAQEIEADVGAAEYLLDGVAANGDMFNKRLLGVALSLLYDTFLELEGYRADDDHQPYVARLWNRVRSSTDDPNHISWAVVGVALSLALGLTRRVRGYDRNREFGTFRDAADFVMNVYDPPR